ncbi:MAG: hypothetical protein VB084_06155 [Syntrophomonadaceae bacterium]|nr:hypothetical protein [Syntrophomonadaceae bacterium]
MTLRLFPASEGHTLCVSKESVYHLFCFNTFLGDGRCGYQYLHHGKPHPAVNLTGMCFEGVNGLEMLDFYLYCGFRLPRETIPQQPVFSADSEKINRLMTDNNLESGKTVLLAPYSTGLADYLLPELFWTELAKGLTAHGFSACTNCSGDERPVEGTRRLFIPIREIVPFLDKSGYFISIRSGLCDVISTSKCKKIVIHTQTAKWWSDGMSLWYTGLNHMGLCSDVVELECRGDNWDELRDEIINTMLQELSM